VKISFSFIIPPVSIFYLAFLFTGENICLSFYYNKKRIKIPLKKYEI